MRQPVQITWDARSIFNRTCDLASNRLTAEELFHIGRSLLVLGLSKMEPAERETELNDLPEVIDHGLDGLDALRQRKKLNGHGPKGGPGHMKGRIRKPAQPVYRSRDPGPRELKRRDIENLYAKAEQKPRPPVSPQSTKGPR